MEVRLLGTGGWLPTDVRETACVYLRKGSDVLLLDAGTGMRRLVTDRRLLDGVERLFVALTHFHLDHTVGLVTLSGLSGIPVREIWLPGRILAGADGRELAHRLLGPPFAAQRADEVEGEFVTSIRELEGSTEIGPFRLETRVQRLHPGTTLALKVDDELAYCTDTAYDEENASFVRGASILLHDAFFGGDTTEDRGHSAAGEAARVAAAAGVDGLVLMHLSPAGADDAELERSARARFPASEVGRDNFVLR